MSGNKCNQPMALWSQQKRLWVLAQESSALFGIPPDDPQPVGTWGGGKAVRLFPSVPKGLDVGFHKFLASGAFEISAELISGKVAPILVKSLSGNDFKFINRWPGQTLNAKNLIS